MKTLHVIDIENVLGGPIDDLGLFNQSKNVYQSLVDISTNDHVLLASNPELFLPTLTAWAYDQDLDQWIGDITSSDLFSKFSNLNIGPNLEIFVRPGKDGADKILNEKARELLEDFDHIVIASGDHYFLNLCNEALKLGKSIEIISTQHGLSEKLKRIPCQKTTYEFNKSKNNNNIFKWTSKVGALV